MVKSKRFRIIELTIGADHLRAADIKKMGQTKPVVTAEQRVEAIEQLLDYLIGNSETSQIITHNKAGKEDLRAIFEKLELYEATYWVAGAYVPAAALADPYTLSYLLEARKRGRFDSILVNQVLGYFDGLTKRLLFPDESDKLIKKRKSGE